MCDCNNETLNYCEPSCNENTCSKTNKCECKYLKPLSIQKLFEEDDCNSYVNALEKAKKARNSFFAAKTAVYNFVEECDTIADNLQMDISDNEIELDNIKKNYLSVLNNVTSSLYTSLKSVYKDKSLINVDLVKVTNIDTVRPQKSTDIKYSPPDIHNSIIIAYLPGVTIELNKDSKLLKLKFSEPEYMSGMNRHGTNRREKDVTLTFILAPSIYCNEEFEDSEDELSLNQQTDVFQNLDLVKDFFEEIQNYQDNYIIDEDSCYGNQIYEIMNYLDKTIMKVENSHKFIVQLCKINVD